MKILFVFGLIIAGLSSAQAGWWNEQWNYKKKIALDKTAMQQAGMAPEAGALALVRLHTGNFNYFLDVAEQGKDIRFIAGDDETPLKFEIEKFDAINEMALIWVKLPDDIASQEQPVIWMYYGNPNAVDGQDSAGLYPPEQYLVYHFSGQGVKDSTAYNNNPSEQTVSKSSAGVIAEAAQFNGNEIIRIADTPAIPMAAETGWNVSMWIRVDNPQQSGTVILQRGGDLTLESRGEELSLKLMDSNNSIQTISLSNSVLSAGNWHHLVVSADSQNVTVYIDGTVAATQAVSVVPALAGDITIGADNSAGHSFTGMVDELAIAGKPVSDAAVKFAYRMQGLGGSLLIYGDDVSQEDGDDGEPSYLMVTLNNVSVDGWVVIGLLAVMMFISWLVMIGKAIVLNKVRKENKRFIDEFEKLGIAEMEKLDREDTEEDEDALESPLMLSLTGGHEKFIGSSIYRIYHAAVQEIHHRLPKAVGADSAEPVMKTQAIDAVRARMEAVLVREMQRLNSQMILLTIAISGGPFLGLLGTVVGVMITFAAIAAQGEVNVNAIAPGIAAALCTTVAGLVVAIPALFGYNYLGSQVKEVIADMYVFVDEFVAKLAEKYSD